MLSQRILLKDAVGNPHGTIIVGGTPPRVTLPEGVSAILCMTSEIFVPPTERSFPLSPSTGAFSLLAEGGTERLFASTLPQREASFAKWRLLQAAERLGSPREDTAPEESEPIPLEAIPPAEGVRWEPSREPHPPTVVDPLPEEESSPTDVEKTELERARDLLERGKPFPLFEKLMPDSRWAIIRDDDMEYLVGIKREEDGEHILFGIPGSRDLPPDGDRLWSYFPTDEEAEIGYYLTEGKELR